MNLLYKKIYIILLFLFISLFTTKVYAKDSEIQYSRENIANYFLGVISANQNFNSKAYHHFKKVQLSKDAHFKYNIEFLRTLVLLGKFDQAFSFSEKIWNKDELFFEADLLLGLNAFLKKDYIKAEKHFKRLNQISRYNLFFQNFVGNILLAWNEAYQNNK